MKKNIKKLKKLDNESLDGALEVPLLPKCLFCKNFSTTFEVPFCLAFEREIDFYKVNECVNYKY